MYNVGHTVISCFHIQEKIWQHYCPCMFFPCFDNVGFPHSSSHDMLLLACTHLLGQPATRKPFSRWGFAVRGWRRDGRDSWLFRVLESYPVQARCQSELGRQSRSNGAGRHTQHTPAEDPPRAQGWRLWIFLFECLSIVIDFNRSIQECSNVSVSK